MAEQWKAIDGFEGLYEVSNTGKVKALERLVLNNGGLQRKHERILKISFGKNKHGLVILCKDGKTYPRLIHRLVAVAFIPNEQNKPCVDHIDTDPTNNNASNLRWVTVKENANNPITRQHLSASKMGHPSTHKPFAPDVIERIRQKNLGKKRSDAVRRKLSEAHKGKNPPAIATIRAAEVNRGKHRSEETKEKLRKANKGLHLGMHWKVKDGKRIWY